MSIAYVGLDVHKKTISYIGAHKYPDRMDELA